MHANPIYETHQNETLRILTRSNVLKGRTQIFVHDTILPLHFVLYVPHHASALQANVRVVLYNM